jgi:hypothetical protein
MGRRAYLTYPRWSSILVCMTCSRPTPLLRLREPDAPRRRLAVRRQDLHHRLPACRRQLPLEQRAPRRETGLGREAVGCVRRAVKRTVADMEVEQGGRIWHGVPFPRRATATATAIRRCCSCGGEEGRGGTRKGRGPARGERRRRRRRRRRRKSGGDGGIKVWALGFWMDALHVHRDAKPNFGFNMREIHLLFREQQRVAFMTVHNKCELSLDPACIEAALLPCACACSSHLNDARPSAFIH